MLTCAILMTVTVLWREYNEWERSINAVTAKKAQDMSQKIYSKARSKGRDLERYQRSVNKRELARPPRADHRTEQLLMVWNTYLCWEKDNPLGYSGVSDNSVPSPICIIHILGGGAGGKGGVPRSVPRNKTGGIAQPSQSPLEVALLSGVQCMLLTFSAIPMHTISSHSSGDDGLVRCKGQVCIPASSAGPPALRVHLGRPDKVLGGARYG